LQSFDASAVNVVCSTFLSVHGRCVQAVIAHARLCTIDACGKQEALPKGAASIDCVAADDGGRS
jgi:hypothetical protein